MRPRWKKMIWIAPLAILAMAAFVALGGEVVRLLWNWLLPPILGLRAITFWQGVGILVLARILFGGLGCQRHGRPNFRRRMEERCKNMTPEEREQFRQRMRERWGFDPAGGEGKA